MAEPPVANSLAETKAWHDVLKFLRHLSYAGLPVEPGPTPKGTSSAPGISVEPDSYGDMFRVGTSGSPSLRLKEVVDMRRYLLVLDMDLLAMDEEHDLEPISYLVARQEQEPCEVVVLSLVGTSQTKLPAAELVLGAQAGKFPVAPRPDHDISAAAEHRMNLAVRHLHMIGCQASGVISDQDLVQAVRSETASHDYDEVILATGRQGSSPVARIMGRDPVQQLRRKWGQRLIIFPEGHRQESPS